MFIRPCMIRQSNWEQVSMCFHLSPDVQGDRCTEIMLRPIPNSIIGNSPCTWCLSIIMLKNWRTDSFSQNRPLQHSYQFQRICTKWLRMMNWSSSMRMSQPSMVMHFTWNAGVGKPVGLGNRTPKLIDDHIGCWFVSRHLFHSDCFLTIPVTIATAERSFSSMKRIKTFLRATMTDTRFSSFGPPLYPSWFQGRYQLCNWLLQWEEKRENQTDLNGNTLTLNNFDMPRKLFWIPKCNRLGTPPGVLYWADGRVLCVFSVHKEEYQYYPMNKERIQNTWLMRQAFKV